MKTLTIAGVPLEFPFEPYHVQRLYMAEVLHALNEGTNAALESPTGTGKTLCLLCATLAWQQNKTVALETAVTNDESVTRPSAPKIIFATRTHSQIAQAVQELQNTVYNPKICVLGSREQLCIHHEVRKLPSNAAKTQACRAKVQTQTCNFYYGVDNVAKRGAEIESMDIEDLVKFGTENRVCPYYLMRENLTTANLIFLPYQYLLDPKLRKSQNVQVNNSIIIFDEAHNIESTCESSASFDITPELLASWLRSSDEIAHRIQELNYQELSQEVVLKLKRLLLSLETAIDKLKVGNVDVLTFINILDTLLPTSNLPNLIKLTRECIDFSVKHEPQAPNYLTTFLDFVQSIWDNVSSPDFRRYYRILVSEETKSRKQGRFERSFDDPGQFGRTVKTLHIWCFSSGFVMQDLEKQGVHSIILTSGTLAPLKSFISDMRISIPHVLENEHVITPEQVFLAIFETGPNSQVALNSSFQNRTNEDYLISLGEAIVRFAQVVPAGMLVFFPAYGVMKTCLEKWKQRGIDERLRKNKLIIKESSNKQEFVGNMESFYSAIQEGNGAVFLAVCRGKVSEGLDFADANGRAVIVTGLPYPPFKDLKVETKKKFLDQEKAGLTGKEWYQQQASRAVNQAIGRVIRHRNDYGAILLCDNRFAWSNNQSQLPRWLRKNVQRGTFETLEQQLRAFFQKNAGQPASEITKKKSVNQSVRRMKLQASQRQEEFLPSASSSKSIQGVELGADSLSSEEELEPSPPHVSLLDRLKQTSEVSKKRPARPTPAFTKSTPSPAKANPFNSSWRTQQQPSLSSKTSKFSNSNSSSHLTIAKKKEEKDGKSAKPRPKKEETSVQRVQTYVEEVKSTLSRDDFKRFTLALKTFKQAKDGNVRLAMGNLVETLCGLFEGDRRHLLPGFAAVLPQDKRALFDIAIAQITPTEAAPASKRDLHGDLQPSSVKQKKRKLHYNFVGHRTLQSDRKPKVDFQKLPGPPEEPKTSSPGVDVCGLCCKKLSAPFKASCGHVCCYSCWCSVIDNDKLCPVLACKATVTRGSLTKIYFA
eukprot:m.133973 g.133973  ORF g.133973 m.133973 type:complete len:1046 (+) comp23848_c0_seq4:11-3148(+)